MRIAVTTPNGNVGQHLVRMLVRAGIRPLALTRTPSRIPAALQEFVDIARADSLTVDEVVAATRGVDALYWVSPPPGGDDPLSDYARATEALVAAVRRNGIRRVVLQSSVGAEKRHGAGEIDGLAATELALDALGIDAVHLRCGYFFTNLLFERDALRAGALEVVLPVDAPMSWVAPRDIAEVAATWLLNSGWSGRHVQAVHGPEDLTWREVALLLSAELGRDIRVRRIGDDEMYDRYVAAGIPPRAAAALLQMSTGLRDGFVPEQPRTLATTTPTSLASWIHDELKPALVADASD
jgi:uncharacterized protein YbjT (DUF2867 family)